MVGHTAQHCDYPLWKEVTEGGSWLLQAETEGSKSKFRAEKIAIRATGGNSGCVLIFHDE